MNGVNGPFGCFCGRRFTAEVPGDATDHGSGPGSDRSTHAAASRSDGPATYSTRFCASPSAAPATGKAGNILGVFDLTFRGSDFTLGKASFRCDAVIYTDTRIDDNANDR